MTSATLIPDLTMAGAFLSALDPNGSFTFQTLDDDKTRKSRSLSRIFHGTLEEHAATFSELQQQGAGVFVMVNEGDEQGRSTNNVVRVRAHFIDLDGAPIEPVLEAGLQPHILVESSPDKWHAYWLTNNCPLHEFKPRQQSLAHRFGGDTAVCDLPRVMRLPGFWHLKGAPFTTRLVNPSGNA